MKLDAGIYEFMKAFRDDRLAKMDSGDIPVSLAEGPTTVLHVLPASAFDPGASVNLSTVAHERSLTGFAGEQWSLSYDFEGVLVWDSSASEDTRLMSSSFATEFWKWETRHCWRPAARENGTTSGRSSGFCPKPRADGCAFSPAPALAGRQRSC